MAARSNTNKVSGDVFQSYLDAIDMGLKPVEKPAPVVSQVVEPPAPEPSIAQLFSPDLNQSDAPMVPNVNINPVAPAGPSMGNLRRYEEKTAYDPSGTIRQVVAASDNIRDDNTMQYTHDLADQELVNLGKGRTNLLDSANISPDMMVPGFRYEDYVAPRENGVGSEVIPSFGRGMMGVVGQAGGVMRLVGAEDSGKAVSDYADKQGDRMQTPGSRKNAEKPFAWADAATTDYWTDGRALATMAEGGGSMAAMFLASAVLSFAIPESAVGAAGAGLTAAASKALSTPVGRATIGKIIQSVPAQALAKRYAEIAATPLGKKALETFAIEGGVEGTLQGGDTTNNILNWNGAVNVMRNPQASAEEKSQAKRDLDKLYQAEGGDKSIDYDHLPLITDGKLRAAKEIGANVILLSASNMLEAGTILSRGAAKAGSGVFKQALNKTVDAAGRAIKTGLIEGDEELAQLAATKGINGMGLKGTPMEGEPFVWSPNPANWNSEQKANFMGGAMVGAPMGAASGLVHRQPGQFLPAQQPAAHQPVVAPAEAPATGIKIGDVITDDQMGPVTFTGVTPEGKAVFQTQDGKPLEADLPKEMFDPSVFAKPTENAGTNTPAPIETPATVDPAAKAPEANEINGSQAFVWKSKDGDIPVTVIGYAGERDGKKYVNIEGSDTAIPYDEIEFAKQFNNPYATPGQNITVKPEKHEMDAAPVSPPNSNWKIDPGAIPGEAEMFLGTKDGDFETATAALRQVLDDQGRATWEAALPGGEILGQFSTSEEAAAAAEKATKKTDTSFNKETAAVGDNISWNGGTGTIAKITKTGIAVKKSDGTTASIPWKNAAKLEVTKSQVVTGSNGKSPNPEWDAYKKSRKELESTLEWKKSALKTSREYLKANRAHWEKANNQEQISHWEREIARQEEAVANHKEPAAPAASAKPSPVFESQVGSPVSESTPYPDKIVHADIKVGDTVTRPGKNDGWVVTNTDDRAKITMKTKQGGSVTTGRKGIVLQGSTEDVATVDPNEKQRAAWGMAYNSFEKAKELTAEAANDDSIENPWPDVIESMKAVLAAQNVGDARIDKQARDAIKEAEQSSKEFEADHATEPDESADEAGIKPKKPVNELSPKEAQAEVDKVLSSEPTAPAAKVSATDKSVGGVSTQATINGDTVTLSIKSKQPHEDLPDGLSGKIVFTLKEWTALDHAFGNPNFARSQFMDKKYRELFPAQYAEYGGMDRVKDSGIRATQEAVKKLGSATETKPAAKPEAKPAPKKVQESNEERNAHRLKQELADIGDVGIVSEQIEKLKQIVKNSEMFLRVVGIPPLNDMVQEVKQKALDKIKAYEAMNAIVEPTAGAKSPIANSPKLSDNGVEETNTIDHSTEADLEARLLAKKKPRDPIEVDSSDGDLEAALKRVSANFNKLSANPMFDPDLMDSILEVGLIYIKRGVKNFGEWSGKMISAIGERVKPYLPSTWKMIENFPAGEKYDQETVNLLFQYALIQYEKGATTQEALSAAITGKLGEEFEPYVKMAYEGITSWKKDGGVNEDVSNRPAANPELPSGKPPEKDAGGNDGNSQKDSAAEDGHPTADNGPAKPATDASGSGLDAGVSEQPKPGPRNSTKPNVGKRGSDVRNKNYIITDKDQLGKGGAVQKYNDNMAAIKLIQKLNEEKRQATPAEQAILVKYVGWGGFPQLFDNYLRPGHEWYNRAQELKAALSPEEFSAARSSTTNAHYTSETVVRAIWDGVKRLGFTSGKVLEPSMGTGNFFGMMPKDLRDSKLTGIELDKLTGAIAKQLYPDANINISGFEKTQLPDDYYDLAISNVPFGDYTLHDPKYNKYKLNIHNYFFVKALDKVRPGGLVVFITGSGTMQSIKQSAVRDMIAGRAELIGAVKLPDTAFKENAKTEVTTDVLFLRKLMPDESPTGHAWSALGESGILSEQWRHQDLKINEYFAKHPEMMLGKLVEDTLHQGRIGLKGDGRDLGELIKKALAKLPKGVYKQSAVVAPTVMDVSQMIDAPGTAREGSVQVKDGKIHIVQNGKMIEKTVDGKKAAEVSSMVGIREKVMEIMRAQILPDTTDKALEDLRAGLKKAYEAHVKKHGLLDASKNKALFALDPDSGLIFGLESFTDKKKRTNPVLSDIFTTRTIQPFRRATSASTPEEGLISSLQETGRVDIDRIAELLHQSEKEVIAGLEGLIFHDPATERWEPVDRYLSGNVRQKLIAAQEAAKTDKVYQKNVDALEKVQPIDKKPYEITARLGSPWIPAADVVAFVDHLTGREDSVEIKHDEKSNAWYVKEKFGRYTNYRNRDSMQKWSTTRYSIYDLVDALLNNSKIEVKDKDADERPVVNAAETVAAQQKAIAINKELNSWLWENEERGTRLGRAYNDAFNAVKLYEANGEHLQIPGMTTRITLHWWQKNAVWSIVQGGNKLIAHAVGLGKTLIMQAAGMKLRQLGLARKPMYAVPNSTVTDFEKKFRDAFPTAKLLVISSKMLPEETPVYKKAAAGKGATAGFLQTLEDRAEQELGPAPGGKKKPKAPTEIDVGKTAERIQARRAILSRIATEDWDGIIITHNIFKRLPMSPESQIEFINQIIDDYAAAIEAARAEDGNSRFVKDLEKQKKRWEAKLLAALSADSKSIVTPFEELGIDYLFVDEADVFKNLAFATKMGRIAGVQNGESQRALDMYAKTTYLNRTNNGSGVVFATGTPISNTMGELFHMMRYMVPQRLRELNIGHFDAWAANFGTARPSQERDIKGTGYRTVERFIEWVNAPELITLFREFADIKRPEDVDLHLPELIGGKREVVVAPMSAALKKYIQEDIAARVAAIRSGGVDSKDDNMLVVTGDLRKAALDIRLVLPNEKLDPESKVVKVANNVAQIWKETKDKRSTQIVFCDMSIPKAEKDEISDAPETSEDDEFEVEKLDASVYQSIKRMLVEKGVAAEEVVFIHDAKTDAQKQALFDKMNSGAIRVLIGSTGKAGVGINVQQKMVAAHHVDVPWRPRDIEQREGRLIRQGNENKQVHVFTYATEDSADTIMWDRLVKKQRMIQHALSNNMTDRVLAEDDMALGFAEIAAITSGNPLIAEKFKVETEATLLGLLREKYEGDKQGAKIAIRSTIPKDIAMAKAKVDNIARDAAERQDISGDKFSVTLFGTEYKDKKEAEAALSKFIEDNSIESGGEKFTRQSAFENHFGTIGGFDIIPSPSGVRDVRTVTTKKTGETFTVFLGTIRLDIARAGGRYYSVLTPTITGIENGLRRIDAELDGAKKQLAVEERRLESLKQQVDKPFDREDEYQAAIKRLDAIVAELTAEEKPAEDSDDETIGEIIKYRDLSSAPQQKNNGLTPEPSKNFLKPTTKEFEGNSMEYDEGAKYITDTKFLAPMEHFNGNIKYLNNPSGRKIKNESAEKIFNTTVSEAQTPVTIKEIGKDSDDTSAIQAVRLSSADGAVEVYVDEARLAWSMAATGADSHKASGIHRPLVLYKGDTPVGLLSPVNFPKGTTLNSGVDPFTLIPGLSKYKDMTAPEAFRDLVAIGRKVYQETTHGGKWMAKMKDLLSDVWAKAKSVMGKVWNEVKKNVSNNRGAIRLGGKSYNLTELKPDTVIVPRGTQEGGKKTIGQLKANGWIATPTGVATVLTKPEAKPKEIPAGFTPIIPNMNREIAYELEQSSKLPKVPTMQTVKDGLRKMFSYMSRKYSTLPRTAQFSPLESALTTLEHKKGVATDTAVKTIDNITKTLGNSRDYKVFSLKVVFDDLAAELAADENYEMPFGLTGENFQEQHDAVNAAVTPNVQAAIDARKAAWTDFKDKYMKAMRAVGFDPKLTKGDVYFHHIVIDYAELKNRIDPTLGSKLRTPNYRGFLKERGGSTKNILTDYLQPEMEVMGQMMYDVEIAKVIKLVSDKYDILNDLKRIAVATNEGNMIQSLLDEFGDEQGVKEWGKLSKKQAMAMNFLEKAAYNDDLPDGNGKYAELLQKLSDNHAANLEAEPEDRTRADISKNEMFSYLNYLIKQNDSIEGKQIAGLMFKGLAEKARAIKDRLGDEHLSWRDLIPEGYDTYQPREGNIFYTGYSIPEHIAQAFADKAMEEIGVPKDAIKRIMLQGGKRREMVVPVEVSATLADIAPAKKHQGMIMRVIDAGMGTWKQGILQMPNRIAAYNFNNMIGDIDAAVAAQGLKAFNWTVTASRELYGVFYRGKEMSPMMKEWFERGGFETLLQTQEAGKVNQLGLFDRFMEKDGGNLKKLTSLPKKAYQGYWHGARKFTDFREAIMRYAKFLDYAEQMKDGGAPKEFGASDPASVMALDNMYDRAFKLSNELMGAYDSISEFGQDMRKHFWAFWSWKEVNATRYLQMTKNSIKDNSSAVSVAQAIGGMALRRSPVALLRFGMFATKAIGMMALLSAYNWWFWPEEERELEDTVKYKAHITLGRDADGKVRYIKANGAFADLMGWIGMDTPFEYVDAYLSGRKGMTDIAADMAWAIPNTIASGVTPFIKTPAEMVYGKSVFPDMRHPRPIRDRGQYLAASLALGEEYKAVFGLPSRPYTPLNWGVVRLSDPMRAGYYDIMDRKQEWLNSKGKGSEGGYTSAKSEALRYYKEALRYQDEQAAVKYLEQYKLAGGTKEGLERSLEAMNPVSGMKKADKKEFVETLSSEDRAKLDRAQQYFDLVISRSGGALKITKKGAVDVKVNADLPSEKKPKKYKFF